MAKLTVFFKYKAIDSYLIEKNVIHLGRDDTNDVAIDSLAVAPAHAAIVSKDNSHTIKQLNDSFPLIVNGQKVKECNLKNNDTITLGKHDIVFSLAEAPPVPEQEPAAEDVDYSQVRPHFEVDEEAFLPPATLQVLSGASIGKVLPVKKSMTRLGSAGSGIVVISKRKDGYYVSALENKGVLRLNNEPLGEINTKLKNNDIIDINHTSLQFFLG